MSDRWADAALIAMTLGIMLILSGLLARDCHASPRWSPAVAARLADAWPDVEAAAEAAGVPAAELAAMAATETGARPIEGYYEPVLGVLQVRPSTWRRLLWGAGWDDSDLMHPVGALITGAIAGGLFVWAFTATQVKWKIDDVLGVWPLHGLCGVWGGIACGIFGQQALGGLGGVSLISQLIGTGLGISIALLGGLLVYGMLKASIGIRLSQEEEYYGADLSIHKIGATSHD